MPAIEENLDAKIARCQGQIAAIYDLPETMQDPIALQGFQMQLKRRLNDKERLNKITVQAKVVTPNGSEQPFVGWPLRERAMQTHTKGIQQLLPNREQ